MKERKRSGLVILVVILAVILCLLVGLLFALPGILEETAPTTEPTVETTVATENKDCFKAFQKFVNVSEKYTFNVIAPTATATIVKNTFTSVVNTSFHFLLKRK